MRWRLNPVIKLVACMLINIANTQVYQGKNKQIEDDFYSTSELVYPYKDQEDRFVDSIDLRVSEFEHETVNLPCPNVTEYTDIIEWYKQDKGQLNLLDHNEDRRWILTLEDVAVADSGPYACKACVIPSSCTTYYFQLTVIGTEISSTYGPQPEIPNTYIKYTVVVSLFFLCGTLCIAFSVGKRFYRKKKRERDRRRLKSEMYRAAKLPHWTRKVVVERQTCATNGHTPCSVTDGTGILVMPTVRIEKQMLQKPNGRLPMYELPFDPDWEVPRDSLIMGGILGEGAFGIVVQAEARRIFQQRNITTVAVKMLKENHSDDDLVQFVKEMELMKMIGNHCNIINLLGCCTKDGPLLVVIEFAPHGNVRDFLRKHRSCLRVKRDCNCLTERDLVSFAYQVAKGMDYLASRKYIHGDLAARNVLVSEDFVLKISDFGLARKLQQKDYYRKEINGLLPIKWMAPESIFNKRYTTQSDVWSYGILLWEIMTLGGSPYPSVENIGGLYKLLQDGYRMEIPQHCTIEMYSVMKGCWEYEPTNRPSFGKLTEMINDIITATTTLEYLELSPPEQDVGN